MIDLSGKRALVSGGSRGIGAAIAQTLAEAGADVAFTYQASAERAEAVADAIAKTGRRAVAIRADSADPDAIARAVEETVAALGGLDILVNSAAVGHSGPVAELDLDAFQRLMDVNVRAPVLSRPVLRKAAAPWLRNTCIWALCIAPVTRSRSPSPSKSPLSIELRYSPAWIVRRGRMVPFEFRKIVIVRPFPSPVATSSVPLLSKSPIAAAWGAGPISTRTGSRATAPWSLFQRIPTLVKRSKAVTSSGSPSLSRSQMVRSPGANSTAKVMGSDRKAPLALLRTETTASRPPKTISGSPSPSMSRA